MIQATQNRFQQATRIEALRGDLARLAQLLLPNYAAPYLIFVNHDQTPPEVPGSFAAFWNIYGFTAPGLDLFLKPWLIETGRWRGRAPAVVLNDERLSKAEGECTGRDDFAVLHTIAEQIHELAGTAVHEFCHISENPPASLCSTVDIEVPSDTLAVVSEASRADSEKPRPVGARHNPHFLRACAHARYRAAAAGRRIHEDRIFSGDPTGAPALWQATLACEAELPKLVHVPLEMLHTYRQPTDFVDLWQHAMSKWRAAQPDNDLEAG